MERSLWGQLVFQIKFTGDAGIVAPALIAEEKHIDEMLQRIKEVLVKY